MLDAVKDKVVGQAMRLMSDPRISRVMGDQRVMSAAMKAVGVGGSIKAELDRATRFAAGLLGFATQEEVSALRSTVQTLEDNLAVMESKAQRRPPERRGDDARRRPLRVPPTAPNLRGSARVRSGECAGHDAESARTPESRDAGRRRYPGRGARDAGAERRPAGARPAGATPSAGAVRALPPLRTGHGRGRGSGPEVFRSRDGEALRSARRRGVSLVAPADRRPPRAQPPARQRALRL